VRGLRLPGGVLARAGPGTALAPAPPPHPAPPHPTPPHPRSSCCYGPIQRRRSLSTARADSRRSGVGFASRPRALPVPAAALVLYI
jgi:hypothetical protein